MACFVILYNDVIFTTTKGGKLDRHRVTEKFFENKKIDFPQNSSGCSEDGGLEMNSVCLETLFGILVQGRKVLN